ncbi:MAG: hypothetical protein IJA47_00375 [Oscillospiraceae bacterium]|nr:hypothetical protein [Oscillospiraceae bacterium]
MLFSGPFGYFLCRNSFLFLAYNNYKHSNHDRQNRADYDSKSTGDPTQRCHNACAHEERGGKVFASGHTQCEHLVGVKEGGNQPFAGANIGAKMGAVTTAVNAVVAVIAATIFYLALRPALKRSKLLPQVK